jgi:RNA polymerase sigma-70 factor, ECF subfamily
LSVSGNFENRVMSASLPSSNSSRDEIVSDSVENGRNRRFVELLGQNEQQLNAFVLALVPHWPDADEIVQKTRIRLWEQFDKYDSEKDFGAWARTIAYYQVLTHRKEVGRRSTLLTTVALEKLAEEAERVGDMSSRHAALAECLERLPASQRDLLARCYGGEESIQHLSQGLGRSFNAIRQALFRLRRALYRCVEQQLTSRSSR